MIQTISEFFFNVWNFSKFNMLYIVLMIVSLTILQKFHFQMIEYIKWKTWYFSRIISLINRVWVIIHEFAHIFFLLLAWAKINKIDLFSQNGWSVNYNSADYISALPYSDWKWFLYIIIMVFQKFMLYLACSWPLIFWIILNIFIMKLLFDVPLFSTDFQLDFWSISIYSIIFLVVYCIFLLPYFILSYKDISNYIFYNWDNFFAKVIWWIINTIIFVLFIFVVSYFFKYFLSFYMFYIISFVITLLIFLVIKILSYFINKKSTPKSSDVDKRWELTETWE